MIDFLLLIIPSLSSCSCRIWSLVFLILCFKCSILCLLFYRKKRNTLWKHWRQLRLQLLGCTAYMPATQLKNGPQIFSDWMRIQIYTKYHVHCTLCSKEQKLRTKNASPIVKSTSPGLSDTTFFARWRRLVPNIPQSQFVQHQLHLFHSPFQEN